MSGQHVAPVHMNHFLMASLDFREYRDAFLQRLADIFPDSGPSSSIDPELARRTYRWDEPEIASFKYLFNFVLDYRRRDQVLKDLFEQKIGAEQSFAPELYVNQKEAQEMQLGGMIIGGHSHRHQPLSSLTDSELDADLNTCHGLLTQRLYSQAVWPFCYPYGKRDSFMGGASEKLKQLGFACSFSTEVGSNRPGTNLFALQRLDCKDVTA
jgi:hypothetical protein